MAKKILLVEDEPVIAAVEKTELEKLGYSVHIAHTTEEALNYTDKDPEIDLILMDIDLGEGISGTDAASRILKAKAIPIVFLSSHTEPEIVKKTEEITSYGYVVKNTGTTVLDASIKMAFKLSESNKSLKSEKEILRSTLQSIGAAVIATDIKAEIVRMNPVAESLTGWKLQDAFGKSLEEVFCIQNIHAKEMIQNPVKKVLQTGKIVDLANDTVLISRDGSQRPIADSAAPILDHDGKISGVVLTFRDVSEEYRIKKELKDSEERFALAVEGTKDGLWDWNLKTNCAYHSKQFARMLGYEENELPYTSEAWSGLLHPDDREEAFRKVDDYIHKRSSFYESVFRMIKKDGSHIWVMARGKCLFDENDQPQRFVGFNRDITQQIYAQEQLVESELKFRQIAENIHEVFWIGSPSWDEIIYISPAFEDIWGEQVSKLYDNSLFWLESVHPEDRDTVIQAVEKKAAGDHFDTSFPEYRIIRPDNTVRWIQARAYPITEGGKVVRIAGIAEDITERKLIQDQLIESRKKYKSILESINDAFFSLDKEFRFTYFNKKAEKILGKNADEVLGRKLFDEVFPEAKGSIFEEKYTQAMKEKSLLTFETYFGVEPYINWYDVNVHPSAEGISVFFTVTTGRKKAESALKESERFNRHITEVMPMVLYVFDIKSGKNVYINREITSVLGYTPEEVAGLGESFIPKLMHPDDADKFKQHITFMFQLEKDQTLELNYRMRTAKGAWRWFASRDSIFKRDEEGRPEQILGVAMDITEQKNATRSLQTALDENQGLLRELQHRVKNSFGMISGMAELLKSNAGSKEARHLLYEIQTKIEAMSTMYRLLYDTGSINDVMLDDYLSMIIRSMPVAGGRIEFVAELEKISIPVKIAIPVGIIASEIFTNSIKHGFPGAKKGIIKTSLLVSNTAATLTVSDNGVGLPEDAVKVEEKTLGIKLIVTL